MRILAVVAAGMGISWSVAASPLLRIEDLGTLGGSQMSGMAINDSGLVAGYGTDVFGNLRAFSATSSYTDITPVGSGNAASYGVNGSGQIVGRTVVNGTSQAIVWSNGTAQHLGGLGGPDSYANAINNAQQIAGMATNVAGQAHAVIYSGAGIQDVSLPGSVWASAYAINNSGAIAGYAMNSSGLFQAYLWSATGGYDPLGTLGGRNSYAFGINDAGQAVGNSNVASGYSHAFIFDGLMHDLGTLGGNSSYAYGINNAGSVVGSSWVSGNSQTHAFVYFGGALIDLNMVVANLTGWELTEAYAINNNGQIAGTGIYNGAQHAFRLDPLVNLTGAEAGQAVPEPSTMVLLLAGLGLLTVRSCKFRK